MTFKLNAIKISSNYIADDLYILGDIPGKKLANASANFPIDVNDEIFCLIDATVFGSCKVGMAFGLKGIYWKNDRNEGKNFLSWQDAVENKSKMYTKMLGELHLGPGCIMTFSGSNIKNSVAMNLVIQLIESYELYGRDSEEIVTKITDSEKQQRSLIIPDYVIAILKIAAIYSTENGMHENIVATCIDYINYDEAIIDKEEAISILQENITMLSSLSGVFRKLEVSKIQAELQKCSYTDEEKNMVNIMLQELRGKTATELMIENIK